MIDYLASMLVLTGVGFALLAFYLIWTPDESRRQTWGAGFIGVGLIQFLLALNIVEHWILPGSYNISFGEPALIFGSVFLVAGLALLLKQDILGPSIVGFFAGLAPIVIGIRLMNMGLTKEPTLSGLGYIFGGLGGMVTLPAVAYKNKKTIAYIAAALLLIGAVIFCYMGYGAYWSHMASFIKYAPK